MVFLRRHGGEQRQKHRSDGQHAGRPRAPARRLQEKGGRQQGQVGGDDRLDRGHQETMRKENRRAAADVADVVPDVNQGPGITRPPGPQHEKAQWEQKPDEQGVGRRERRDVAERR